jgi:succinate dehydrogenase / fumarate reductase cytochrome b subunit
MGNRYINTSIGRKFLMALSAIFLMIFLLQHLAINFLSVLSPSLFNSVSHFMGTNPLVQFALQPVLISCRFISFHHGFCVWKSKTSRQEAVWITPLTSLANNSSWVSRNMIYSGATILAFSCFTFYRFLDSGNRL